MSTRPLTHAGPDPEARPGTGQELTSPDRAEAPAPPRATPGEQSLEEAPYWEAPEHPGPRRSFTV
jgi:hypothetical protein